MGFYIKVEKFFSVAGISMNLQHFQLGVNNLEMLINIYKIDQMMLVLVLMNP